MNPYGNEAFDSGMRAALTYLLTGKACPNLKINSHSALRYVKDKVSVPGDMSIWAAKRFRQACEDTASQIAPQKNGVEEIIINERSRSDQNPTVRVRTSNRRRAPASVGNNI